MWGYAEGNRTVVAAVVVIVVIAALVYVARKFWRRR
jgi:heme/copper-type cytochrome/quinol oxidase subunit 2